MAESGGEAPQVFVVLDSTLPVMSQNMHVDYAFASSRDSLHGVG